MQRVQERTHCQCDYAELHAGQRHRQGAYGEYDGIVSGRELQRNHQQAQRSRCRHQHSFVPELVCHEAHCRLRQYPHNLDTCHKQPDDYRGYRLILQQIYWQERHHRALSHAAQRGRQHQRLHPPAPQQLEQRGEVVAQRFRLGARGRNAAHHQVYKQGGHECRPDTQF